MPKTQALCGGWSPYRELTDKDKAVFNEALKGFCGVGYQPKSVSTQIVAGVNYRFKCDATLPGPIPIQWEAIVEIYAPLEGKPHITGIQKI